MNIVNQGVLEIIKGAATSSDYAESVCAARRGELFAVNDGAQDVLVIAKNSDDALAKLAWWERGTIARDHPDGLAAWALEQGWSVKLLHLTAPGTPYLGHPSKRPALALVLAALCFGDEPRPIAAWRTRDLLWPDDDGALEALRIGGTIGWRRGHECGRKLGRLNAPDAWRTLCDVGFVAGSPPDDVISFVDVVKVAVEVIESIPPWLSADGGVAERIGAQADGCEVWAVRRLNTGSEGPEAYYTAVQRTAPGAEKSSAYASRRFGTISACRSATIDKLRDDLEAALTIATTEGHSHELLADLHERLADLAEPYSLNGDDHRVGAIDEALKAGDRDRAKRLAGLYLPAVSDPIADTIVSLLKG